MTDKAHAGSANNEPNVESKELPELQPKVAMADTSHRENECGDDLDSEVMPTFNLDLLRQISNEEILNAAKHSDPVHTEGNDNDDPSAMEEKLNECAQTVDYPEEFSSEARESQWIEELEALQMILGDEVVSICELESRKQHRESKYAKVNLTPYCGDEMPLEDVSVVCTFRVFHNHDEDVKLKFSNEKGLTNGELMALHGIMREAFNSEREQGDPIVYDMVTNARQFLTQKVNFVAKEDYTRIKTEMRQKAETKRRILLHKKRVAEGAYREVYTIDTSQHPNFLHAQRRKERTAKALLEGSKKTQQEMRQAARTGSSATSNAPAGFSANFVDRLEIQVVPKSVTLRVSIKSYVMEPAIAQYLPSIAELSKSLHEATMESCKWTIESVLSPFLLSRFLDVVANMEGEPRVAFHGTDQNNSESIAAHGLLVPGVESDKGKKRIGTAHGSVYGYGVYASKHFSTAACYSRGSIFLCLVQQGRKNTGRHDWKDASSSLRHLYDSNEYGSVWVLFSSCQVLPCLELSYVNLNGDDTCTRYTFGDFAFDDSSSKATRKDDLVSIAKTVVSFEDLQLSEAPVLSDSDSESDDE